MKPIMDNVTLISGWASSGFAGKCTEMAVVNTPDGKISNI
jgi:hypothetical protein